MPYRFDLNLQQRAALRIAIWFWERKEVKDKAAEFFGSSDEFETYKVQWKWHEFTKTIVREWNKDVLPQKLEGELIHIVKMIGRTIFRWFRYIKIEYKGEEEAINCIDEIKWTPYGTVDAVKIFKSSWLNNPRLDITKVYNFSCRYVIEEHIDDLWKRIPNNIADNTTTNMFLRFDQHILAYWNCCRDDRLLNFMEYLELIASDFDGQDREVFDLIYDSNLSTEENMLRLSVHQGHFVAMKYFWDKLTEEERDNRVLKCSRIAVLRWSYNLDGDKSIGGYKRSQYVEICLFLMNQMTNRDKKPFFNGHLYSELGLSYGNGSDVKNHILEMLLCTWPWEELFVPVLEDMLRYIDDDNKMDCNFLDAITFYMCLDHKLGYSLETNKYKFLLREVWFIIPAHFKRKIPQVNTFLRSINYLIDTWDLVSLNLIINDPEIAAVRDQFIDFGRDSYEDLLINGQFETLDLLIEEVFKFEEEKKKSFKQEINLNPWSIIFEDSNFDLADKVLDWQSSTSEERQTLKNNIDHMDVCKELIRLGNLESLDKFLDWKFETIEERISCEEHFKSDEFAIERVYELWKWAADNINDAEERSSEFLERVFESNEEIKCFKKEKLVNFENDRVIIYDLINLHEKNSIDKFLSWCSLDDTEIQRIKQRVSVHIQLWN